MGYSPAVARKAAWQFLKKTTDPTFPCCAGSRTRWGYRLREKKKGPGAMFAEETIIVIPDLEPLGLVLLAVAIALAVVFAVRRWRRGSNHRDHEM
jgi:hypothetical protein